MREPLKNRPAPLTKRDKLVRAVETALDASFDAWLERWGTPAGICDDAPPIPKRLNTDPAKILDAILAELREPDEYMRAAGFTALVGDQGGQVSAEEIWQAMIDAIE